MSLQSALPLVFLPGIDGTRALRAPTVARLARSRSVVLIDYPDDAPTEYAALADWIAPRLPDGRFVLLGESYSGPVATLLADHMPSRVAGLIFAVTFVAPPLPSPFGRMTQWLGTGFVPRIVIERVLANGADAEVLARLSAAVACVPDKVMSARAIAALRTDVRDVLARVRCPVLSLEASHDRLIPARCGRIIANARPDRQRVVIAGPHMILETHIDACARAIEEFVATLG